VLGHPGSGANTQGRDHFRGIGWYGSGRGTPRARSLPPVPGRVRTAWPKAEMVLPRRRRRKIGPGGMGGGRAGPAGPGSPRRPVPRPHVGRTRPTSDRRSAATTHALRPDRRAGGGSSHHDPPHAALQICRVCRVDGHWAGQGWPGGRTRTRTLCPSTLAATAAVTDQQAGRSGATSGPSAPRPKARRKRSGLAHWTNYPSIERRMDRVGEIGGLGVASERFLVSERPRAASVSLSAARPALSAVAPGPGGRRSCGARTLDEGRTPDAMKRVSPRGGAAGAACPPTPPRATRAGHVSRWWVCWSCGGVEMGRVGAEDRGDQGRCRERQRHQIGIGAPPISACQKRTPPRPHRPNAHHDRHTNAHRTRPRSRRRRAYHTHDKNRSTAAHTTGQPSSSNQQSTQSHIKHPPPAPPQGDRGQCGGSCGSACSAAARLAGWGGGRPSISCRASCPAVAACLRDVAGGCVGGGIDARRCAALNADRGSSAVRWSESPERDGG